MKKVRALKEGVVIDNFGNIAATIMTRETAGMREFSYDIHKDDLDRYVSINSFVAKLTFSKKLLEKAKELRLQTIYHIYYQKNSDGTYSGILER